MRSKRSILIKFLTIQCLVVICTSQKVDYFYFVQQWPGSYCDSKEGCCYPTTGKPASNFIIDGLWPNDNLNSQPSNCKSNNPYDESKIPDLIEKMKTRWPTLACPSGNGSKLWSQRWEKYGTCSESVLDQHDYFKAAINLKDKIDLLKVLKKSGIKPDGSLYSSSSIKDSIRNVAGHEPGVECNVNKSGTSQLYQILLCSDPSGKNFIDCPALPVGSCADKIILPFF